MSDTEPRYEFSNYYAPEELGVEIAALRPRGPEGRPTWVYLGFLGVLFVFLLFFSWACNNDRDLPDVADSVAQGSYVGAEIPVALTLSVDGDIVTIQGAVPDQPTRVRLVALVDQYYDDSQLIDATSVAENVIADGGSVRVSGVADESDTRPDQAKKAIIDEFGFDDGGTELLSPEEAKRPVGMEIQLGDDSVLLRGQVPDQASIDTLVDAVGQYWAGDVIDASSLEVSDRSTWDQGSVRLTGTLAADDLRYSQLEDTLVAELGDGVTVDASQLAPDVSEAGLATVESDITTLVTEDPVLFEPQSAEIQSVSDETLVAVAEKLNSVPDTKIEVIGHTDDLGDTDENQVLSLQRAGSVKVRLVSLGVEEGRITIRGMGETQPLVDEDTPEARAKNRRIEFKLIAADTDPASAADPGENDAGN